MFYVLILKINIVSLQFQKIILNSVILLNKIEFTIFRYNIVNNILYVIICYIGIHL
jgi:hypothetical protein